MCTYLAYRMYLVLHVHGPQVLNFKVRVLLLATRLTLSRTLTLLLIVLLFLGFIQLSIGTIHSSASRAFYRILFLKNTAYSSSSFPFLRFVLTFHSSVFSLPLTLSDKVQYIGTLDQALHIPEKFHRVSNDTLFFKKIRYNFK